MGQVVAIRSSLAARATWAASAVTSAARRFGAPARVARDAAQLADRMVRAGHSAAWSIAVGKACARRNTPAVSP